jgi:hypothetical protein
MSMKNSNDTIGNRTRELPTCSAVPQPTALPRAPRKLIMGFLMIKYLEFILVLPSSKESIDFSVTMPVKFHNPSMTHPLPVSNISKYILALREVKTEQLMSVLSCFPKLSFFILQFLSHY